MKKLLMIGAVVAGLTGCDNNQLAGFEYRLEPTGTVPITLNLSPKEGRFFGKAVNNYFGTYTLSGNTIQFTPMGTTMMMGAPDEMMAERTYLNLLPLITQYSWQNGNLVLTTNNGQSLTFKKTGPVSDK